MAERGSGERGMLGNVVPEGGAEGARGMRGDTEGYGGDSEGDTGGHMGDHGWERGRYGGLREEHLQGGLEWDAWVGHGEGLERTRE